MAKNWYIKLDMPFLDDVGVRNMRLGDPRKAMESLLDPARERAAEAVRRSNEGAQREPVEHFLITVSGEYDVTLSQAKKLAMAVTEAAGRKAKLRRL